MAPLRNPRRENFCLAYVAGVRSEEAYRRAFRCKTLDAIKTNSTRLLKAPEVIDRIKELQGAVAAVVVERTGVTNAAVVEELAKLAFADIREVVTWKSEVTEEISEDDSSGVVVITRTITPRVVLTNSEMIDEETAKAIASVSQSANGTLTVKMHNKVEALKILEDRTRPSKLEDQADRNRQSGFIDAPPRETWEQWLERERLDGHGARALAPPTRSANGGVSGDVD